MHIGFLTPEYPHRLTGAAGGLGTSLKNLSTQLIKNGIKISIFIYGQDENSILQEEGINFYIIKQKRFKAFGWYLYRKSLQRYLNSYILSEKIDLVEAPDWTGITAFMKLQCPLVIRMNGSDGYFCHLEDRHQKWKNRFFEGTALKSADALISVSDFTAKKTKEIFKLKDKVAVIPNSVDTEIFSPIIIPIVNNRLLYFGTVIRKKGVLELAFIYNEVVKKRTEVELIIIGKDVIDVFDKKSTLEMFKERLSAKALDNFTYIPEVGYQEIRSYIAAAEVVVLPSFAEALPMTWLEAMAMEKTLVTSNIGWAKEIIVRGKSGYFEDPRKHKAYADLILKLLSNPILSEELGKQARKRVIEKFSTEAVAKKNISFYSRIIR